MASETDTRPPHLRLRHRLARPTVIFKRIIINTESLPKTRFTEKYVTMGEGVGYLSSDGPKFLSTSGLSGCVALMGIFKIDGIDSMFLTHMNSSIWNNPKWLGEELELALRAMRDLTGLSDLDWSMFTAAAFDRMQIIIVAVGDKHLYNDLEKELRRKGASAKFAFSNSVALHNNGANINVFFSDDCFGNEKGSSVVFTGNPEVSYFNSDPTSLEGGAAAEFSPFNLRRESVRKSRCKSSQKSRRKSVRRSRRKSARKSRRKSVRKSRRKSVRKSRRKSVRKSRRKSVRKSRRKSARRSRRKSARRSRRKSARRSRRKSARRSRRKSVRRSVNRNMI
jgi:hypothetical protein